MFAHLLIAAALSFFGDGEHKHAVTAHTHVVTAHHHGGAPIAADQCAHLLDAATLSSVNDLIAQSPVVLLAMTNVRCTIAAQKRFEQSSVCFKSRMWSDPASALWGYLKCKHPETDMHSYVYIGGKYIGDGFSMLPSKTPAPALAALLGAAKAPISHKCGARARCAKTHLITHKEEVKTWRLINRAPVVLYGWGGCPCTGDAQARFSEKGVCYVQTVWPDRKDPLFSYLQCLYGDDNHSFVFFGGEFVGNGFVLAHKAMSDATFMGMLAKVHAKTSCIKKGDRALTHKQLKSCTQDADGTTTGWTRSGSCNWDPTDGGYHEVCVTMSEKFLASSAKYDGNDLHSVVKQGGHWCICAWAFASAVTRDPTTLEGIELACDRTNEKLRSVYQHFIDMGEKLTAPSGAQYESQAALDTVNRICGKRRRLRAAAGAPAPQEDDAEELGALLDAKRHLRSVAGEMTLEH
jgi:uncharacterized protein (DUF2237 family)